LPGPSARASYGAVIAVVATIVAVIAVGLLATRGARPAAIHLSTLPIDAEVQVDGKRVRPERSPFVIGDLEPEVLHEIKVGRAGYQGWSTTLTLQPGQVLKLPRVELAPDMQPSAAIAEQGAQQGEQEDAQQDGESPEPGDQASAEGEEAAGEQEDEDTQGEDEADEDDESPSKPRASRGSRSKPSSKKKASSPPRKKPSPEPAAAPSGGGMGTLRLNSRPWSQVVVDGRAVGNTPQTSLSLSAGTHTITLVNPQFGLRKTIKVRITAGKTLTKIVDLQ
jgi:hypothetical protein